MDLEYSLNIATVIALLIGGIIFIYEGFNYMNIKNSNNKLPTKLYVAGILTVILGIISITLGIIHYVFWM